MVVPLPQNTNLRSLFIRATRKDCRDFTIRPKSHTYCVKHKQSYPSLHVLTRCGYGVCTKILLNH